METGGRLKASLSLFDAVNIALGAMIGAGIFVIIGSAAALAGPGLVLSIIIGALVAGLTGIATAELSRKYPTSGGAYTFAKEVIGDKIGFIVGWVWLFSNIAIGATVALGFGSYLAFFFPSVPAQLAAGALIIAICIVNLIGAKESSIVNNILVAIKIGVLLVFVVMAAFSFKITNFTPFMPFGVQGVLAGAAAVFFAYSGFARVAVIADEIKDPKKNVAKATLISIVLASWIYFIVAAAAIGAVGYLAIASSQSPLADAMVGLGFGYGAGLIGFGALIATATVALGSVLGLSRIAYTMARNRDLPGFLARIDKGGSVPVVAIVLSSLLMLIFAWHVDLASLAYLSSFSLLLYYVAINLSGIKVLSGATRIIALFGALSCGVLLINLPLASWMFGFGVIFLGLIYLAAKETVFAK